MLLTSLRRVTTFGLQSFWRNLWLSAVTVTIITLSLLSVSLLLAATALSQQALSRLEEKIDIAVYLKPELDDARVRELRQEVERLSGVKSVEVVSATEALERFRRKHEGNPIITESLLELGQNPLGATLIVKALSDTGYRSILGELEGERLAPLIQEARFDDYRRVIEAMSLVTARVTQVGSVISLFFVIITVLVVFNAIRIAIYTHREEIFIMRLVGATSWFIRGPFWVECVLYAALATLITAAIFFPLLSLAQPYVDALFNGYRFDLAGHFQERAWFYFGLQFLGAALLNILASTVAMRRYLKA